MHTPFANKKNHLSWAISFFVLSQQFKSIIDNGKTKCLHFMNDLGKVARFLCTAELALGR